MDVFATVLSGVLVFVFGQGVQRFVLEPIAKFHKERADLSYTLLLHQAAITNVNAGTAIQDELKQLGASIVSEAGKIPALTALSWVRIFRLPTRAAIQLSARELNGIIHSLKAPKERKNRAFDVEKALTKIGELLCIDTKY